ncbi:MAG: GlmU family protein [Saprospiraceae bacterium]|nr:GlmU family protein [Saprospiraceae bacterium]
MNIILFDSEVRAQLLPFTFLRPVCELRIGILTIREKWERQLNTSVSYITQDYLAGKFPIEYASENYLVNGSVLPSRQLLQLLQEMEIGQAYLKGEELIAAKLDEEQMERLIHDEDFGEMRGADIEDTQFLKINNLWDIYRLNGQALQDDFDLITQGRTSQPLSDTNRVVGRENIFVEPGASVEFSILNATTGPIYIGADSLIMEGCMIRGGLAFCEGAVMKMGAKIYGPTTIGPGCKVGGEINNSVFLANSNKSHDGYLGNSVIGEWCNIGADTNCSNLKNTYEEVRLWSYTEERFVPTGQQFCGLFLGDYSRTGINTMLNTGTVTGISANIYGDGFPRNFIPSFSWGGAAGFQTFRIDKAFDTAERIMSRRNVMLDIQDRLILLRVYEDTAQYRHWEKKR